MKNIVENREIKFRAWSDWDEKMTYFSLRSLNDTHDDVLGNINPLKIQQYTGLKDGKGKDIYEGDIIRPKLSVKDMMKAMLGECIENYSIEKFEVCWNEGCFELYDADHMYAGDLKQVYDGCEVLGNIYKNPELLRRK